MRFSIAVSNGVLGMPEIDQSPFALIMKTLSVSCGLNFLFEKE